MRTYPSTLIPAYGRDYKSKAEIKADIQAEKCFLISDFHNPDDGRSVVAKHLQDEGYGAVRVRYQRLTKSAEIAL